MNIMSLSLIFDNIFPIIIAKNLLCFAPIGQGNHLKTNTSACITFPGDNIKENSMKKIH